MLSLRGVSLPAFLPLRRLGFSCAVWAAAGCCQRRDRPAEPPSASSTFIPPPAPVASADGTLAGASTYALIAGVLRFADPSVTAFSAHHRKDQELYDRLIERGVPASNMSLLLDDQVTAPVFRDTLDRMARSAPAGSTLLVYYAGHGARAQDDGSTSFLTYEGGAAGAVQVDEIGAMILHAFRGARVLLMGDCCYSGALKSAASQLYDHGIQAVSITSADASNASTQNWTFTQTVIDALAGEPLMDRDGDGAIVLRELGQEVADAMKYREHQRAGFACYGVSEQLAIAKAAGQHPAASADGYSPGSYAEASDGQGWLPVRVLSTRGARSIVRFYHYSDALDVETPHDELRPIRYARYPVGAKVRVLWDERVWDARVIEVDGDFHKITYPGWSSGWDEWILSDRIVGGKGSKR